MLLLLGIVLLERGVHFSFLGYPRVTLLDVPLVLLMQVFAGSWITGALFG
jgi:hypothetical protein